ncbi:hypothetical protein ABEW34_14290 [Paenibacillus algorifonticola]|uniref:hypothetical protein n=1 Tax=Paenibacillus algorifonticola TaxID=684063 RepID=UPI003D2DE7BC
MMPCLNKNSLKLLVGTADERYDQSPEYFRKTHFPQVMHRFNDSHLIAEVTEGELLEELKEVDSDGNRVYLVFGSTGSGKSELLRWIKDKWLVEVSERPVIRISRTELNPQTLIKKCLDALNLSLDVCIDEDKWGLLLKKPITLVNQMVWTALAESLESDEEIVPAALLLRSIIEKNIVEFTSQVKRGRIKKPLEVLHREQFESLLVNTTVNIPLEYATFRQTLSRKLDHFLFEGRDIGTLFKQLSQQIKSKGIRPLLLIDDLVQSVNIYATNILDQLITLEEGNWDVVIGLTPGAVQDTEKGFSLTQRIQNLDTINDRVKKLWLSDESGKDFFNLDRGQVIPYMAKYLTQLKATQGFKCSPECPYYDQCSSITTESSEIESKLNDIEVQLLPFNSHMLRRTYDAIPMGKGKLRYMILNSKEVIRFFLRGKKDISRILPIIRREMFAEHSDVFIKTLAEWYASEEAEKITISEPVLRYFGYKDNQITVKLNSVGSSLRDEQQLLDEPKKDSNNGFNEKAVVRDWVEGRDVNEELLLPVRSGVAALVHDAVKGIHMSRSFTSKTSSSIQRNEVVNRTRYPITLQNNKDESTISVSRGFIAIQIANFQTMKYSEKVRMFQKNSNEYEIAKWIHQAESIHDEWLNSLEQALGLNLPVFVYGMKYWVQNAQIYSKSSWASNVIEYSPFRTELLALLEDCYSDWYLLRDNFFQPPSKAVLTNEEFDYWFMNLVPSKILEHYQIGDTTLRVFLSQLKESYHKYFKLLQDSFKQSLEKRMNMIPFLLGSNNLKLIELAEQIKAFSEKKSITQQDFVAYTLLEQELDDQALAAQYKSATILFSEMRQLSKQFDEMMLEVESLLTESCAQTNYEQEEAKINKKDEVNWSELEAGKANFIIIIQELESLKNCLALTPRNLVKYLLDLQIKLGDLEHIKKLLIRLENGVNRLKKKKHIGAELSSLIAEWQSIDFYELRDRIERKLQHEQTKLHLLQVIRNDFDCEDVESIYHLLEKINESPQIRPSIKRHIRLLIENGYSTLPPIQWKRLLDEIKEKFPNLFDVVEIRLVVGDDK